jgi:hypothetical protein
MAWAKVKYVRGNDVRYDYVNLATAVRTEGSTVIDAQGQRHQFADEIIPFEIVPSPGPMTAVTVNYCNGRGERPTADDVVVHRWPIIAWKIAGRWGEPVLPQSIFDNEDAYVALDDGSYVDPIEGGWFGDLDAVCACVLEREQERWDRVAAKKATENRAC